MLAALCLAMVFAICLTSYIALCYTALTVSTRNLAESHAIELAEAGVELALYSESNSDWASWYISSGTAYSESMTMTSSGLVLSSSGPTALNLGNGVKGTVSVTITNYLTNPSITSTATMTVPNSNTVIRKITTTAGTSPLFMNTVAAISGKVKFAAASSGSIDSYDSRAGSYASQSRGYQAVVLSQDMSSTRTVRLDTEALYGYAVGYDGSAPTTTGWFMGTGKVVGPTDSTNTSPDMTRVISDPDPYQPIFTIPTVPTDVNGTIPSSTYTTQYVLSKGSLGTLGLTTPQYYLASGINITSGTVTVVSPVVIVLYGSMNISGTGGIQLTTANSALTIFVENSSATIGANGITSTIANPLPKRVSILSTNNNSAFNSITISTTTSFFGTVYFPYLPITISSSATIYGSIIGDSVTFTGSSPTIHYDLALRYPDTTPGDFAFTLFSGFGSPHPPTLPGSLTELVGP